MCVSRRTRGSTWRMNFLFLIVICGFICIGKADDSNSEDPDTLETSNQVLDSEFKTKDVSLAEIFEEAHQAYLDNNWDGCIERVHDVLHEYKIYRDTVIKCRRRCRKESNDFRAVMPENIEDLHFYEKKVRETWCLMKCNQDYTGIAVGNALKKLPIKIEHQLVHLGPYEYLHICYAQKSRYQEAADAVFTYLVKNPRHEMSIKALKYYLEMPGVNENEVINLEAPPFLTMYINGVSLYDEESYDEAIKHFETSLRLYLRSEEDCRYYCEGSFNQGWYPEFTSSIANHFTYCLKCKRGCSHALNNINGEYHNDLLQSHYNYLQFAYYKLGRINEACKSVASYLLFDPADEVMLKNKDYYASLPKVQEEDFVPREEALKYVKRQEYELRILRYITEEFGVFETNLKTLKKKRTHQQREDNNVDKLEKHDARIRLTLGYKF